MVRDTILYVTDQATNREPVLAALKATGCEVVITNSSEVFALLFLLHSVAGVVIKQHPEEEISFDLVRRLQKIRPDVPIVLQVGNQIERLPLEVEEPTISGTAA